MKTFFNSLSISNKIAAIFAVFFLMMGIGGFVGLYNTLKMGEVTESLHEEYFKRSKILESIEREFLSEREEVFYHALIRGKSSKSFIQDSISSRNKRILELLNDFKNLGLDEVREPAFYKLRKSLDSYRILSAEIIALSIEGEKDDALKKIRKEGSESFKLALDSLKVMLAHEDKGAFNAYEESKYLSGIITKVTLLFTILAIFMAAFLWLIVTRSIVNPIIEIERSAKLMASGDLKHRAQVSSKDELGKLAKEFNRMAESLEEHYTTLEKKVSERTEELRIANNSLYENKVELEGKNEELARASNLKSQFLANVSHELRTPLNSIIGFSELLQEKAFGDLNEKQLKYVKYVHTSGEHLLLLINNILDLSKIEAGRMELTLDEITLTELVEDVVATIVPLADKRGIKIITQSATASPVIRADKPKMKQILINLLSNAVKFNVDEGTINVGWDISEELIDMKVHKILSLFISDTGIGIRKEDMGRLFREFEQLDPSVTREHGGTGLGLSLTKKLAELHGGRILVESVYGKGCKFIVKIPQFVDKIDLPSFSLPKYSETVEEVMSEEVPLSSEDKPLIIVAGESEDMNHLVEIYIGTDLYEVMLASDGEEVLELVKTQNPFAVVMGIALPKKDGWEVLKELKENPETSDVEVVIISSSDNKELGYSLGAVDYLVKPVSKDKLLEVLGRVHFSSAVINKRNGPTKVLVVDDEAQVLDFLSDILIKEGLEVLTADGGEKGVELAFSEEPDLIILDLMMPDVSGFDVVDRLKKSFKTRNIPIVIFTAKDLTDEEKNKLEGQIHRVIQKAGFNNQDLLGGVTLLELSGHEKSHMIDSLTKLFNRRYFDIALYRELARSDRYGDHFSTMVLDIDSFESFNKVYGRQEGDIILCEVANILLCTFRKLDIVTRYSGDEFAVIMPGTKKSNAVKVAEKIRNMIAEHNFKVNGKSISLTASFSVMSCPTDGGERIGEQLSKKVKEAYLSGGNRVSIVGGS